jgi:hypothetical protein
MKNLALPILLLLLTSCVSGSFGNHREIEDYPLRAATREEGRRLKRCLRAAHRAQENYKHKTGNYASRVRDLPIDDACQDFTMGQRQTGEGYEIRAQFSEDESTVRWSITSAGVIEEHLDPGITDLDLEL